MTNDLIFIILLCINIFIGVVFAKKKIKDNIFMIAFCLLILLFLYLALKSIEYTIIILVVYLLYLLIVISEKVIIMFVTKSKIKIDFEKSYFLFLSPDFMITSLFKNKIIDADNRAKFIKYNNYCNMLISLLLLFILYILCVAQSTVLKSYLIFIFYRLISRSFEIIISFVLDIIDSKKRSSLDYSFRIKLALISIFEVIILLFMINYISTSKLLKSVYNSFALIINSISSSCNPIIMVSSLIGAITVFCLIGLVIANYIDRKNKD